MDGSRREFLLGAAALSALTLLPPSEANAAGLLTATMTFADGRSVVFSEANGVDAGAYTEPSGAFIQDHRTIKRPELPGVTMHFCRDRATNPREEVWIYYGRLLV